MNTNTRYPRLSQLAVNKEGFVFEPETGESFTVNSSGNEILTLLMANEPDKTIMLHMTDKYSLTQQNAQADIRDFLEQLRAYHLV
jgi:uncharacterized protein (DUF1684 family)